MPRVPFGSRWPAWLSLALIVLSLLVTLGDPSVAVKPDEPLYGAIAEGMARRHDPVVPMLDGQPAFYKPPLLYWMGMVSMAILGPGTFALRLVCVVCGLLLLVSVYRLAEQLYSADVACLAVALVGTSLGFVEYSRAYMMDLPMAWLYVLASEQWLSAVRRQLPIRAAMAMVALGLATLLKGPVVDVMFVLGIGVFHATQRQYRKIPWSGVWAGCSVAALIVCSWLVALQHAGLFERWFDDFVYRENVGKFLEARNSFLVLWGAVLGQMWPWTFLIGASVLMLWRNNMYRTPEFAYPLLMALAVVVVYSLPERKLPHYVVPAVPLLIVAGVGLLHREQQALAGRAWFWTAASCLVTVPLLSLGLRVTHSSGPAVGVLLAVSGAAATAWCASRRTLAWTRLASAAALMWTGLALAQSHFTTTLDVPRLTAAAGPQVVCGGVEIGMAVNDWPVVADLVPVQASQDYLRRGFSVVLRQADVERFVSTPVQVRYAWQRWRDGVAFGDLLTALYRGDATRLQEEIVVVHVP